MKDMNDAIDYNAIFDGKPFIELDAPTREYVLQEYGSEAEYESQRMSFQRIRSAMDEDADIEVDGSVKEELMKLFEEEDDKGMAYIPPKGTPLWRSPYMQLAIAASLVLIALFFVPWGSKQDQDLAMNKTEPAKPSADHLAVGGEEEEKSEVLAKDVATATTGANKEDLAEKDDEFKILNSEPVLAEDEQDLDQSRDKAEELAKTESMSGNGMRNEQEPGEYIQDDKNLVPAKPNATVNANSNTTTDNSTVLLLDVMAEKSVKQKGKDRTLAAKKSTVTREANKRDVDTRDEERTQTLAGATAQRKDDVKAELKKEQTSGGSISLNDKKELSEFFFTAL